MAGAEEEALSEVSRRVVSAEEAAVEVGASREVEMGGMCGVTTNADVVSSRGCRRASDVGCSVLPRVEAERFLRVEMEDGAVDVGGRVVSKVTIGMVSRLGAKALSCRGGSAVGPCVLPSRGSD